jgi:hypothetical protein
MQFPRLAKAHTQRKGRAKSSVSPSLRFAPVDEEREGGYWEKGQLNND